MAQDYSKLKNDELQGLLKDRGLPHTGKKADMVSRLQEDDTKNTSTSAPVDTSKEDEIDWDDDDDIATTAPAQAALDAGGLGRVNNPTEVPNQVVAEDPATTNDLSANIPAEDAAAAPAEATAPEEKSEDKPPVDFSSGLAKSSMVEELEKRLARAKKFGAGEEEIEELQTKLARAVKFGNSGGDGPTSLNEALPEKPLGKKRMREGGDDGGRGGKRGGRNFGRGGFRGGRGGRGGQGQGGQRRGNGQARWSEDDKARAEARKARFAAPAAET